MRCLYCNSTNTIEYEKDNKTYIQCKKCNAEFRVLKCYECSLLDTCLMSDKDKVGECYNIE